MVVCAFDKLEHRPCIVPMSLPLFAIAPPFGNNRTSNLSLFEPSAFCSSSPARPTHRKSVDNQLALPLRMQPASAKARHIVASRPCTYARSIVSGYGIRFHIPTPSPKPGTMCCCASSAVMSHFSIDGPTFSAEVSLDASILIKVGICFQMFELISEISFF